MPTATPTEIRRCIETVGDLQPILARDAPLQTAIVHVADILAKAMGRGVVENQPVSPLAPKAWKLVNLDDNALAACVDIAWRDFDTIDDLL